MRNQRTKHRATQQIQGPVEHTLDIGRYDIASLTQGPHDAIPGPDHHHQQATTDVEYPRPLALGRG
jgi:hypothetical protein